MPVQNPKSSHTSQNGSISAHLLGSNPGSRSGTPLCDQEAKRVASTEGNTSQEGPFLADEPLVVLEEIRVIEKRIECECGEGVDVGVPRNGDMETSSLNLR